MIKKDILDSVLLPFLNVNRQPPYLKKQEYSHLTEENVEIYISSAWYESHWMWKSMLSARDAMLEGLESVIFAMDYLVPLHYGLLSRKRIDNIKSKKDFDQLNFSLEYENLMYGQNADALFALEDVDDNRNGKKAFYPINNLDYFDLKDKKKEPLKEGEVRVIGVDVALMGGKNNDNTIITCVRLIPNGDSYKRQVLYIESIHGKHTDAQATRIRQVFEDFQAHYIVLDSAGNGLSVYDALCKITYDEERDVEYEAYCSFNDDEMAKRALSKNPMKVIYTIKGNRNLNHEIATSLRSNFQSGNIELLINEIDALEYLKERKLIKETTSEEKKAELLMPFAQTTATINELVNLDHEIVGGKIVVSEASGKRKDRYSSLAYANYLAKVLEKDNLVDDKDEWDMERSYVLT